MVGYLSGIRNITFLLLLGCMPMAACAASDATAEDCAEAVTTLAINQCAHVQAEQAEKQMERYLSAARKRYMEDSQTLAAMESAQQSWSLFRQRHCSAVHTLWRDGTMRGLMHNQCMLQQTHQRTYDIWQVYLTSMDGGSMLPRPAAEVAE